MTNRVYAAVDVADPKHQHPFASLRAWADPSLWLSHWAIAIPVAFWALGYFWQRSENKLDVRAAYVQREIDELYRELGWNTSPDDIRCTLWTPVKSMISNESVWLMQLVDYAPKSSLVSGNQVRHNGKSGRTFRALRRVKGLEQPIGLLGIGVNNVRANGQMEIRKHSIPDNEDFAKYMEREFNFRGHQARRLTPRRSFLIAVMAATSKDGFLAVLFCDSDKPDSFDVAQTEEKIAKILPRIAGTLTIDRKG